MEGTPGADLLVTYQSATANTKFNGSLPLSQSSSTQTLAIFACRICRGNNRKLLTRQDSAIAGASSLVKPSVDDVRPTVFDPLGASAITESGTNGTFRRAHDVLKEEVLWRKSTTHLSLHQTLDVSRSLKKLATRYLRLAHLTKHWISSNYPSLRYIFTWNIYKSEQENVQTPIV